MNGIERRLVALEGKGTEGARIMYAAAAPIAEAHHTATGGIHIYVVNPDQQTPLIDGGTVAGMMQRIAKHGRRITNKTSEPVNDNSWVWRKPEPIMRDRA